MRGVVQIIMADLELLADALEVPATYFLHGRRAGGAMARDYAAEMRTLIDQETARGVWPVPRRRAGDRGEAHSQRPRHCTTAGCISTPSILSGVRSTAATGRYAVPLARPRRALRSRRRLRPTSLATALPARTFPVLPYVVADDSRSPLAKLDRQDLLFVAETYDARSKQNALRAAFFRALAKKVGRGCVEDHFDEVQIAELRGSLG